MAIVVDLFEDGKTRSFKLSDKPLSIGRSSECDIQVSDPNCSKIHCEIRVNSKIASVKDLGSKNGTIVNGENVTEAHLYLGVIALIGKITLQVNSSHLNEDERKLHSYNPGKSSSLINEVKMEERTTTRIKAKEYIPINKPSPAPLKKASPEIPSRSVLSSIYKKILSLFKKN